MSRNNKSSNVGLGNNALEKGMNGEDGTKEPRMVLFPEVGKCLW